jgi:C-terminal processing protease CtpA/Prc
MRKLLPVLVFLAFCGGIASAADKGYFGFGLGVKGEGMFNPTVKSVTVQSIQPGTPAAEQKIAVGDEIVEVEGVSVPGRKANELKPLMEKKVGEVIHLRLKRANGEIYSVTMTAIKRPD